MNNIMLYSNLLIQFQMSLVWDLSFYFNNCILKYPGFSFVLFSSTCSYFFITFSYNCTSSFSLKLHCQSFRAFKNYLQDYQTILCYKFNLMLMGFLFVFYLIFIFLFSYLNLPFLYVWCRGDYINVWNYCAIFIWVFFVTIFLLLLLLVLISF